MIIIKTTEIIINKKKQTFKKNEEKFFLKAIHKYNAYVPIMYNV